LNAFRTQAQLVAFDPASAGVGAIGTVVPRAEFAETAAKGEFPATFLLDLDRVETEDGGEVTAHTTVAVDWDKDTLEQLLASTDEPEITLWFDERELAWAFDDVEAQGLRQKAAILAVAVAAAGASTTPAFARLPADVGGGSAGAAPVSVSSQPMGVERGLAQDAQITVGQAQATSTRAHHESQPMGVQRGLAQDAQITVPTAGTSTGAPEAASGGNGPSAGEIAAIAGAGALLISAAGFGVARKRTPPVLPA
jgi:hypothetical protein